MPNVFAVYYKGRPLKETSQNWLLLTPEKLITMKSYRSPLNNSDDIFSVSFPYRFRIVSVSFPYRSPIILLSSSYHPPIAKRKTIRNGTKNERMRFGGTRVVNFTITWVSDLGKADWKPCYGCRRIAVFVSHSLVTGLLVRSTLSLRSKPTFHLRHKNRTWVLVLWKRLFA